MAMKQNGRYSKQLERLQGQKPPVDTKQIEDAVAGTMRNLASSRSASFVIYGEPQSGKTEMMICLTAKLLDNGHKVIVHLMNDSVDLLAQNLKRFKQSGLSPAAKVLSELPTTTSLPSEMVVFCKKNSKDLEKLIRRLANAGITQVIVIDDEADFATPNAKINQGKITKINQHVATLLGTDGIYIGVTATPARLDLNNTFNNKTELWVQFKPHANYTGWEVFFPLKMSRVQYRLTRLGQGGSAADATAALVRFLVTASYLNTHTDKGEQNWTMLVHTSGKKADHKEDQKTIEEAVDALQDPMSPAFAALMAVIGEEAAKLYPAADVHTVASYVVLNRQRISLTVLNSERERLGENATDPTSPFTIIIGGNIVSRGVTFPNLLSMFFTRDVTTKLQQDTYIQRARMFGARGGYLKHFELTIPTTLYADWRKCFIFHKLALETINSDLGAPVWLAGRRVTVAASASIDRSTVTLDRGEMAFKVFDWDPRIDTIIKGDQTGVDTLSKLRTAVGPEALPQFLIDYIQTIEPNGPGSLAIHVSLNIDGYRDADKTQITRAKGFIGTNDLERHKFPSAAHHIKVYRSEGTGKARVFYKFTEDSVHFVQNRA
ncbi:Z1 domain-containing protein [Nannocystis pusilla]|uniref:DNA helicase n=1 Tax=Nannocystis pusilla TaxID=889268 RepID=A0ABS7U2Y5_9BACT|nr:Z1 domain-containing protein [Nannocystis pusilla]MBZ5714884.1 hypothetical protein [Nannocystis pusilla]